jgi:NADP-dependent 3-hydroxy acid dehydrogenase YdfG
MAGRLDGKVAVVTGASSGIGEATAEALAAEGAVVVVAARREDRLSGLVERIEGAGGRALAVSCDVTDEAQAHALIQKSVDEFGRIDVLVNNAGVMLLSKVSKGLSDQWRQMFEVNVMGLLYATDAAIEHMKRQGSGHLVNISSVAGRKVTRDSSGVYAGTKFAVGAISEGLRQELLEDNIRVAGTGDPAGRGHRERHRLCRNPARKSQRERGPDPSHPTTALGLGEKSRGGTQLWFYEGCLEAGRHHPRERRRHRERRQQQPARRWRG